jgi:hypothetical protein
MKYIKEYGIRDEYSKIGVMNFYKFNKTSYINPHLEKVHLCLDFVVDKIKITNFLDLAAGNGEVTSYLKNKRITDATGCDPYLFETYEKNTGKKCLDYSFENISDNGLNNFYQTIICSYALHLCDKSYFNNLLYNLSINCEYFVLISPSKYPIISNYFQIINSIIINKSHCKIFKSLVKI